MRRAVLAGLEITREVSRLSEQAWRRFGVGVSVSVRVGVHRGLVYLDTAQDDVYGLAANLAARVSGLAPPGSVVVSDAVEPLVRSAFELEARPPAVVKGVAGLVAHHRVIGERAEPGRLGRGPLVGRDRELVRLEESWARARAGRLTTPGWCFGGSRGSVRVGWRGGRGAGAALRRGGEGQRHPDARRGTAPIPNRLSRSCGDHGPGAEIHWRSSCSKSDQGH